MNERTGDVILLLLVIGGLIAVVAAYQEIERHTFSQWLEDRMQAPSAPEPLEREPSEEEG